MSAPLRTAVAAALGLALGGLAVTTQPAALLVLAVAIAVAFSMARSPFFSLALFVIILFARPGDLYPALSALRPAMLAAVGSLGVWVASKLLARDLSLADAPTNRWMTLLTVLAFLSTLTSTDRGASTTLFKDVFVKIVALYLLILNLVNTPRRARQFRLAIAGVGAFLGSYAIHAKITGAVVEGSRAAMVGLLGDPNDLAFTLLTAAPYVILGALKTRGRARLGFALLGAPIVLGLVFTQSRGGLLGLGLAVYLILRRVTQSRALTLALVLCFGGVAVVASGMQERKSGAVGAGEIDESAQGRLDAWKAGGRMMMRRPALGVGLGRFADNFEAYASNAVIWGKHETHNAYIKAGAEAGVVALFAFLMLLGSATQCARRLWNHEALPGDIVDEVGIRSLLPCIAGMLVSAFFLSQCWGWFLYVMVAEIAAVERMVRRSAAEADRLDRIGVPRTPESCVYTPVSRWNS